MAQQSKMAVRRAAAFCARAAAALRWCAMWRTGS
jgi:hypothetical protein